MLTVSNALLMSEGIWCDAAFRMMVRKIVCSMLKSVFCSACPRSPLEVEAGTMGYRVDSEVRLQPIDDW